MLALTCPTCGEPLQALDEQAGKATCCRECGEPLRLPGQGPCLEPATTPAGLDYDRFSAVMAGGAAGALAGFAVGLLLLMFGSKAGPLRVATREAWTVNFRPAWVGEWPEGENVREANEMERIIEQRLQDGTLSSVRLRPNVLVLGGRVWERAPIRERESFLPLFADYFDLKGVGRRYEIRAPGAGGQPGNLLATYSPDGGLRPVRDD